MDKTRMGKRVASLLLSLVMMLSLLPTAAYATMADGVDTQGAIVSENGTGVSDDSNSNGDTGAQQVGGSSGSGTADDTASAKGGADLTDSVNGNDSADPQDDGDAVLPVASSVVSTSEELVAAITAASDGDTITLGAGEFTTVGNTSPKKSLTFVGAGEGTVWTIGDLDKDVGGEGNGDYSFEGCDTITFKNMTLKVDNKNYRGFIRINHTVVENCTLEGRTAYWGYETAKFVGSTFTAPEGDYALWDYSTKDMSFDGCTFNISGKGVHVYVEAANADKDVTRTVAVNSCIVNSTKENKAFLNIKNSTQAYDVTLSGTNTVNGLTADGTTGSALYQVETTKVTETTGKPVAVKAKADDGTVTTLYEVKETVAETTMDLDAFIKAVVDSGYNYDGNGVTVKWSPVTGCYDTREGHACTANNVKATGNTPKRVSADYAQYQLFSGLTQNVTIKNVKFVYEPAAFTICANSGWAGSGTVTNLAELQFENKGDVKLLDCSFDGVAVAVFNDIETTSTVVHGCSFTNMTKAGGGYAIHYLKGGKIDVSENTFENVYRGMLVQSTVNKGTNIVNNNFSGIDATNSSCYMVKLLNVKDTDIVISGNTTAANAPVNVNVAYDGTDGAAIAVGDRISTIHTAETDGNGVAISTGGNQMTGYTAPSAAVEDASGITVDADGNVTVTLPAKTTSVAEVNGAKYDSLQAAVDAAKSGATVTLLADTRENVTVSKNAIVLDLNGHTLNGGTENAKPALTVDNKKVTLKDSSEAQTGTIKREDTADTKTSHYVIDIQGKNGFMIVESGKVENNSGIPGVKGSSLIRLGNDSVSGWPTLTIKGGTFTQDNFIAIKVDRGTLHLLGGTVNSANSFAIENWNNAYIKGGTVNGTVSTWVYSTGAAFSKLEISGGTVNGNVASVNYDNAADKQARVYVTGGTVTGTLGTYTYNNGLVAMDETAKATIEVTGGTFSKDPTQYVVENSAITENDDGTYGVAKTYLAKIGDTEYYTMDEAFHAVKAGETIVMLRDYTTNKVQNSGDESFTIDLGGHTWTANIVDTASAAFEINYSDVTLTVKNGKVVSSQLAGLIPSAMSGTITYNNSKLVFDGVEMTANGHSGIETNGSNTNDTVTLKNSTLNVPNGYGIYFPSSGTLTIDNSVINAKTMGVQVCSGSLNISGAGTAITVSGDGIAKTENDGAIEDGAAISIVQRTGYKDLSKIEVEDGKFTANGTNAAVKAYKWESQTESAFDNSKNVVAVSGGTFSSAVDKSLCADGFIPTQNTDGTYGVKEGKYVAEVKGVKYDSLQAAIDKAGRNAIVTLLADTRENVTIATPMTLDLNGHTLNGGQVKAKPALTVTARVTVKDGSAAQTGTIMREDTAENSGVSSHYVIDIQGAGWLTFESGNVKNNSGTDSGKGASLVRVGDDSVAKYPGLNIKGGTFTQDNFIVIKVDSGDLFLNGGTLNSANSYAIEDWHRATIKGGTVNGTVAAWTYSDGHDSTLSIEGGTIKGNVASVSYDKAEGKLAKVSISGGTVDGTLGTYTYGNGLIPINDATKATIAVTGGTFSSDPTKYVVEDSGVTKNDDGTYGVAKAYLAKVGDTSYYTMDEAFKAQTASGEAIVLLRDYTTGSTFNSGTVKRTVDLNGHTWTCTGTDANSAAFEINNPNATLTVKNGKVVSSQLVGLIPSAMGGTIKYDNSSLEFDGVEMTTTARSGIETNGNNTNDTVTLRNSTLNVPNGFGIYFPSSGKLIIENSKINAKTMGVQVCSGSLNISGADTAINVSGDGIDKTINDGAIEDGAAISIVNRAGYKGLTEIKVEGGKFTAKGDNAAVKAYDWANQTESGFTQDEKVAISGGTFSSAVDKSLCADGYIPTQNADGTYGVKEGKYVAEIDSQGYESLQAAINAAQDGQTVTLLADAAEDVVISKSITLDLGGKTLTNTNAGNATISVQSGTVTVKNGNVVGGTGYYNIEAKKDANLTLTDVTATAGNNGSSMIDNWGTLTITSGTYTGGMNTVKSEEGSVLNISGGTFTCDFGKKWSYTAVILVYGTTTITGGEFIQKTTNTSSDAKVVMTGKVDGYEAFTKVTGGTFTNEKLSGIFHGLGDATADNFEVSGGTFNKYVSDSYMADGFIPVKNADGTYGVKEGKFVAEVGSTGYETFDEAIAAANASTKSATIYLRENITVDHQLVINNVNSKAITLNLQGFTLTSTYAINAANKNGSYALVNQTTLTVRNGTFAAGQARAIGALAALTLNGATVTQQLTGGHACVAFCADGKSYTIKNSTIEGAYAVCSFANNATIAITGSTLTGTGNTLYHNGSNYGLKLTVKDTTITSSGSCGVYISGSTSAQSNAGNQNGAGGYQQATFTGCTISGALNGVEVKYTDLTLDGCTVSTTAKDASYKQDNNGPAGSGFAVVSTDNAMNNVTPKPEGTIIIKGTGKYTGPVGLGSLKSVKETYADFADETIKISGGTFTTEVPAAYCADGFIPTQNADGTYGVKEGKFVAEVGSTKYETLAEAVAAAEDGQTITLLCDVADCGSLTISKNITLDGGGHTISGNSSISVNMPGNAAADVTIKNVTFKDIANGNKLSAFYFSQVKGKLTITGCTFDSIEYEAIQVTPMEGAEVNVSNNVFKAKADGTQVRHIHIEMAYGSGFDCEGQNIKLTVTDNQLHGAVCGDASMGIWWVGTGSTLKVDGNYMEHPETVSITLANSGVHYNRGDLIYPARSQADADVDDLMPAVIVADKASGESKIKAYNTLAKAIDAAQDGQTVRLLADVEQNTQLTIDKSITLDLNGKTIKNTADIWGKNTNAILSITNGAKVTITGNGTIDAKENDCYTINVVKGDLTIENGTFYGNVSVVQVQEGTLSVKGGTFDLHQKWEGSSKYLINCIDDAYVGGSAKVAISGGTFVGFDPNVSPEQKVDGKTSSFAAPGVGITKNENGSFTAAAGMTAQILDKDGNSVNAYNTLAEAVAAAEDGQTVRLLADVTLDAQIATGKAITIDGQSKYTIKAAKLLKSEKGKAGMFYRTGSANGTLTFLNVTLDGCGVSKIFLNEGGAGETVFDGVTSTNGGGWAYGSGIHISGGGSHATIRNSTLTGSTGTTELNDTYYYAANDLWVGGNVYVTVENSVIGNVFVNSAPSATATNGVVHGQLTITGENTKITYLSGEEESADKLDKFGNNGSLVKIDSGYVEKVFDKGSYAISGGTFKTEVKKEWCAAGYVPTQNGDGTYGVEVGKFTVMVTSRTTGSNSPVANVTGGGSNITYAQGTKVTASAISGYNFVGWFVNDYTGTPYSTDLTCVVKPTDDCTMIAVYEPISGGVFALEVSASKFTVNGGATQRSYLLEKMPVGTQVTVVFKGSENFLYWVNESGKVVSTSKTYTFSMGSATTLKAVYAEKEEHQAMVVFISHTQQVISSKGYTDTQEIQFPEPPIKMGATFVRWSMTEAEIRAAMATTTTGIIVVEPVYEFSAGSYTVTVDYPNDETATYTATVGKITTVTAKSIDGKVFKCWKNGDTVLGYTETLKIAPRGDLILTAEYVDAGTTVDRLPVIALTEISASQQGAKYAVSFTATRSVPDGYTVTEQGVLVSTDSRYGEAGALDAMKLDADGDNPDNTQVLKATNTDATGVTVLNGIVSAADRTVYGRAYMILRDSSGTMVYVYSDTILSGSYNSLTTNGGN